jgi:hypothetical protein
MHSENVDKLAEALSQAQGQMKHAVKDRENPFFKSQYATLSAVWDACRKPLSDNGLAVVQSTDIIDGQMVLISRLIHSSGQWIDSYIPLSAEKPNPQSFGSALTYYRRYSLAAIVGIAPDDDDDGNSAEQVTSRKAPRPVKPTKSANGNGKYRFPSSAAEKFWNTVQQNTDEYYNSPSHLLQVITDGKRWFNFADQDEWDGKLADAVDHANARKEKDEIEPGQLFDAAPVGDAAYGEES